MLIRGSVPASCFGLGGADENAGTAALGWVVDQAPTFRRELLIMLGSNPELTLQVSSQVYAEDRGFTDLELIGGTTLHAILEAKLGWQVPDRGQLERYAPRLRQSAAREQRLVSVSAADATWASRHLPATISGIPVQHISWSDIRAAARRALQVTRAITERVWLEQLIAHLAGYGMTSNVFDARAYVVSLNREPIKKGNPYTWIDVVQRDGRYFHPVGISGFPVVPPAYLGFRFLAEFRSAHFVTSVLTTDRLQDINPCWPDTDKPHFVYTLGPAMAPAKPMKLGKIHPSMRNTVALDLLLSGVASDYKHAIQLMHERLAATGQ